MHRFALSFAVMLTFTVSAHAQTNVGGSITPDVLRGTQADPDAKSASKPAAKPAAQSLKVPVQKTAAAAHPQHKPATNPQTLRATRYGAAPAPAQPQLPPPSLDTNSPRSLSLLNVNTTETLTVTYWSDGAYHRDALDKLNLFLRDSRDNASTEMDPLLFDVLWHTMRLTGYSGSVEVLSAYRSPTTNAWLASVSRGVARDSQHMNGNAMDIRFPGVAVYQIRQAARSLQMGGVGFYPRSGFVHLDTGSVRYW